jgi:hypothetical protein
LSEADIVAKFRALTDGLVASGRRDAIQAAVLGLEDADDLGPLTELLAAPVAGALD